MLLSDADKQSFIELLRRPNLSSLARKIINKKINDKCKKCTKCHFCSAVNGEFHFQYKLLLILDTPNRCGQEMWAAKNYPPQV